MMWRRFDAPRKRNATSDFVLYFHDQNESTRSFDSPRVLSHDAALKLSTRTRRPYHPERTRHRTESLERTCETRS